MNEWNKKEMNFEVRHAARKKFWQVCMDAEDFITNGDDYISRNELMAMSARYEGSMVENTGGNCWLLYVPVIHDGILVALVTVSADAVVVQLDGVVRTPTEALDTVYYDMWENQHTAFFTYESVEL